MLRPVELRTDYLREPLGLGNRTPRLFWRLEGSGKAQTAWRVQARTDTGVRCWDSGRVESASCGQIAYAGRPLESRQRVRWRVKVWDDTGEESEWSDPASFEMGLLEQSDWEGWWIAGDYAPRRGKRRPADCFLRTFRLMAPPARARLYITACGVFEVYCNGQRVGADILAPGWTDARRRILARTYDVTALLRTGTNRLELLLGDGWYRGRAGLLGRAYTCGSQTKLLAQLEMTDQLGDRVTLASDASFRWSCDGETGCNDLMDGETAFCGREPGYEGHARLSSCPLTPEPWAAPGLREAERYPATVITTPAGRTLLDFGQNLAGQLEALLPSGEERLVTVRLGETLDEQGELTQGQDVPGKRWRARQTLQLHLQQGENRFRQRFSLSGFRYAWVEGLEELNAEAFTAVALCTGLERASSFACSDEGVNRLYENVCRTLDSGLLDAPGIGPGSKRIASGAVAAAVFQASLYWRNAAPLWQKWLGDLEKAQRWDGCFPACAPFGAGLMDGSCGWSDAAVLVTWGLWRECGDVETVRTRYPALHRYARFLLHRVHRTPLLRLRKNPWEQYTVDTGCHFGEVGEPEEEEPEEALRWLRPHPEEATAWLSMVMGCMADLAAAMGREKDQRLYAEYAQGAAKAWQHLYGRHGEIRGSHAAKLVRPLAFGLLPQPAAKRAMSKLLALLRQRSYHAVTGIAATGLLLELLGETGHMTEAYRLLMNREEPGWLNQVDRGATTVWGTWRGLDVRDRVRGSYNSPAYCAVGAFLLRWVVGIRRTGENRFALSPRPGGGLTWAHGAWESPNGRVEVRWEQKPGGWLFEITIPTGASALLTLPDGSSRELSGGRHLVGV